jgi:hypothetical protein
MAVTVAYRLSQEAHMLAAVAAVDTIPKVLAAQAAAVTVLKVLELALLLVAQILVEEVAVLNAKEMAHRAALELLSLNGDFNNGTFCKIK